MPGPLACRPGGTHVFAPVEAPGYRCDRCGLVLHAALVGWYELGVEDGRRDAWSKPTRPRAPRWAIASALALGVALVGASPPDALPEPPPAGALEGLRDCLAAASSLEADVEAAWGRTAGPELARANRSRVRDALTAAQGARSDLAYADADARPCAANRVPGCAAVAAPMLSARGAAVASSTALFRKRVDDARLTLDR